MYLNWVVFFLSSQSEFPFTVVVVGISLVFKANIHSQGTGGCLLTVFKVTRHSHFVSGGW